MVLSILSPIVAIGLILCLATIAPAQDVRPVFDARLQLQPAKVSADEAELLKRTVQPVAALYWKKKGKDCEPEFVVIDAGEGSFTKAALRQKAILYRYCMTGHNFGLNGIAVLEHNGVVAHVLYEGAWDTAIGALPDLNHNGLSEILIASGGISTAVAWGVVSLIELQEKGVSKLGQAETELDDCQLDEMREVKTGQSLAYKILVKPGTKFEYYRETFRKGCNDAKGKWKRIGTRERIPESKDEKIYERLQ
jgi:hypothetical protein